MRRAERKEVIQLMKDSIKKRRKQKTLEEGLPFDVGVELRSKVRALSSLTVSPPRGNDGKLTTSNLLELILHNNNLNLAYKHVVKNKGSHGIDGMKVNDLFPHLKENGENIKKALLEESYRPNPVKRVEIPKPDGGIRSLGVPTVLDRTIQQAIAQILTPIFEEEFSNHSYGFRPGRSCHDAIKQAKQFLSQEYEYVVDIDLEKFFDRVNHDILMSIIARKIRDKRVLKLIRKYLESGIMIEGLISPSEEGTPQGGPLSPLLSNIMLNELDKELEKRGHKFCRYADDCNIYVRSLRAGQRVMKSITNFIEKRLKLKVNQNKSAVDCPTKRKFLGFSFSLNKVKGITIHKKSLEKLKDKIRKITSRSFSISLESRIKKLNQITMGWINYFAIANIKAIVRKLDEWIRRRLRMCIWKQWKKVKTRHKKLVKLKVSNSKAWNLAKSRKGFWRISRSPILSYALTNKYLKKLGLKSLFEQFQLVH
jgi:RNA-directed DNA polymerase